uniref:Uncharacterized protein n=1 Tax=Oryzias sinensis TaxID=183150 RepID=A0A8C7WSF8_9TELE
MQVCNLGWHAFNIAHKNMDQINVHTGCVPDYMKAAVNFLFNDDDEIVKTFLPNQLESIHTIADECVKLGNGVEQKYNDVICLIQELLEACINAKHIHGEYLEEVKNKIEENKLREQTAKELDERYNKAMEDMEKQVEEAQEEFKSSMNSIPAGTTLVAMKTAHTLTQITTIMASAVTAGVTLNPRGFWESLRGLSAWINGNIFNVFTMPKAQQCTQAGSSEQDVQKTETEEEDPVSTLEVYSRSSQILSQATKFPEYIDKDEINWKRLYDQKKKKPQTENVKKQFERISGEIENAEASKAKDKALSLCQRGIDICEQIETYSPEKTWDEKKTEQ